MFGENHHHLLYAIIVIFIMHLQLNQYNKRSVQKGSIQSNMQFVIHWKGPGSPVEARLIMDFKGVKQPKNIATQTNAISMLNKLYQTVMFICSWY